MSNAARFSQHFFNKMLNEQQIAKQILKELTNPRKTWPYTKSQKLSSTFKETNAQIWKGVFQLFSFSQLETFTVKKKFKISFCFFSYFRDSLIS